MTSLYTLHRGDCTEVLKTLAPNSVEAAVTDPPYGLGDMSPAKVAECLHAWARGDTWTPTGKGFMGKQWDAWVPPPELWREVLRVLKPGGHAIVFAGSRTQDLMSVSLRLAGFEVRDTLLWLYGSGFPKSLDVSKALDKQRDDRDHAQQWQGWGTALKPAYEPAILARKPLDGTVAQNTLAHGCGALNIDACRVDMNGETLMRTDHGVAQRSTWNAAKDSRMNTDRVFTSHELGRWPANVILDEDAAALLDAQTGEPTSRFFYCAKASRAEREAGLENDGHGRANHHPTVKPIALMRYLVRLITPPGATCIDPFMGSGSTGCAVMQEGEGRRFVGIEREPDYLDIARARLAHYSRPHTQPGAEGADDEQLSLF